MSKRFQAIVWVVALAACGDSPFEPHGLGERVPIGQVIEDQIADSVERRYSFDAATDAEYVVYLKSLEGFVVLTAEDSIRLRGLCAVAVTSNPGPVPLEDNPTPNCVTPIGGVQLIKVRTLAGRTARYHFMVLPVNRPPEIAETRFGLGDTVMGETIDPVVDADVFYAHGDSGQTMAAVVEPLGGATAGGLIMFVENPDSVMWLGYARGAGADPLFTSGPLRLRATQDYRFVVRSEATANRPRHLGAYRFWSYVVNREPEHLPSAVVANFQFLGERIDYPNDVDEFTFQDTVGAEYNAFVESGRQFVIQVVSPGSNDPMIGRVDADDDTALFHHGTGPFQLTSTGTYKIRVQAPTGLPWAVADTGAYRFMLYRIDRRPEVRLANVSVGDTVVGESIDPAGDIDEFTLFAPPGDALTSWFRLTGDPIPGVTYMSFQVYDRTTQALLVQTLAYTTGPFAQGATFVVPASGDVQVRIGRFAGEASSAPYEFFFGPPPPIP